MKWIAILSFLPAAAVAAVDSSQVKTFHLEGATVRLEVPSGWQDALGVMDAPLTLLGPERNGFRPIVSLVPTGAPESPGEIGDWQAGRKEFLRKNHGELKQFYPEAVETWPSGAKAHVLGLRYKLGEGEIVSRTYYVACKAQIYLIKSLVHAESEAEFGPVIRESLRTFACD
jgi:hypothetical protein